MSKERRDGRHTEQERVLHTLPLSVSSLTMQLVPAYPSLSDGGGKIKDKDPPLISGSLYGS